MRHIYLFAILLLVGALPSYGQTLQWAKKIGGTSNDIGIKATVDINGNLYLAGSFQGNNVDFDPGAGTFNLSSAGLKDGFVAKYDKFGVFKWAFKIGGANHDEAGDVALDNLGNIVITGFFRGANVDFDPSPAIAALNSNGQEGGDPGYGGDIFVAQYDTSGNYKWAFGMGGLTLGDNGLSINTDSNNDVLVGGYFRGIIDFDPSSAVANLNEANGTLFVAKYSSAGQYRWALNAGQGGNVDNAVFKIAADNLNNVLVTGFFQGTNVDFDPSSATNTLSSTGGFEFFLAKYSPAGNYIWAKSAKGSGTDVGRSMVIDNNNDIYVTGDFNSGIMNFNEGLPANNLVNNGANDVFLVKYAASGQHLWSFAVGGSGVELGWGITKDAQNNILITGGFSGTNVDFDPSSNTTSQSSAGDYDIYSVKYNSSGQYVCAFRLGGVGDDRGNCISSYDGNNYYIIGQFNNANVDFDPSSGTTTLSSLATDVFFAKYDWTIVPATGSITGNSIACSGQGQLTFTATSGIGPFTLFINNGTSTVTYPNIQSGVPFNIIPSPTTTTTYTLSGVKDANICGGVTSANSPVTINVTPVPITTSGSTSICQRDSAQLFATGGISYVWSPSTGLSSTSIANPKASPAIGTLYKVVVTSAGGCKDSATLTVSVKLPPQIAILPNDASFCPGDSIELTASGGISYQWSPANGLSNASIANPKAAPMSTTTYKLIVTNSNSCKDSTNKIVTRNQSPVASILPTSSICAGDSLQLNASGGAFYQWSPATGLNNAAIANPKASPSTSTTYKVVVTNANGCKDSTTTTVTLKPKPIIAISPSGSICKGDSLQLTASGGISYEWSPAAGLSDPHITNPKASPLSTTTYKAMVSAANGCHDSSTVTITVNQPPIITLTPNSALCLGDSIQLQATGGTTYQWSPGEGLNNSFIGNPKASPTATTTYKVIVRTAFNCIDSSSTTIAVKAKPVITITNPTTICDGDTLQLNATGGTFYTWTPAITLSNSQIANPKSFPSAPTSYQAVVTNIDGCKDSLQTLISVNAKPKPNLGKDTVLCTGKDLLLNAFLPSAVSYLWNSGATTPTMLISQPGTYSVLVNASGCTSAAFDTIIIKGQNLPTVALVSDTSICSFNSIFLKPTGTEIKKYLWNTGSTDSIIQVQTPGLYTVIVTNSCGNASDEITIKLDPCSDDLYFPTGFTPNSDRKNDLFKATYVSGVQVSNYELSVFNRWGELVFYTKDVNKGWNGQVLGKLQRSDVFVWIATYKKRNSEKRLQKKGTVLLIR